MATAHRLILVVFVFVLLVFVSEVHASKSKLAVPPIVEDEYASVRQNPEVRIEKKIKLSTKKMYSLVAVTFK